MATKVMIHELSRIGRAALKLLLDTPEVQLAAVHGIGSYEEKNGKEQSR